jgi:hypothetical protein
MCEISRLAEELPASQEGLHGVNFNFNCNSFPKYPYTGVHPVDIGRVE